MSNSVEEIWLSIMYGCHDVVKKQESGLRCSRQGEEKAKGERTSRKKPTKIIMTRVPGRLVCSTPKMEQLTPAKMSFTSARALKPVILPRLHFDQTMESVAAGQGAQAHMTSRDRWRSRSVCTHQ